MPSAVAADHMYVLRAGCSGGGAGVVAEDFADILSEDFADSLPEDFADVIVWRAG